MQTAISIFGQDRPGIIASLTNKLANLGANIEDASMTLLQGHFAMILVVTIENMTLNDLENDLRNSRELEGFSISVSKELGTDSDFNNSDHKVTRYIFHLAVSDTPGIVARVTEILGSNDSNVVDCATRKNNDTGVFSMILDVDVPNSKEQEIVELLGRCAQEFSGDVVFQRMDDVSL